MNFVYNVLGGGGHFDTKQRTKWQRELAALNVHVHNTHAMNHHMRQLLSNVLLAIDACGVEKQL